MDIITRNEAVNWTAVAQSLQDSGYALVRNYLTSDESHELIEGYDNPVSFRKTIIMERYRFGQGAYKYFNYPLPALIQSIRETVYSRLAPVADRWMAALNIPTVFPADFSQLQTLCKAHGQTNPTVLILKYGKGGHNTMHQDLYGDIFFPIQAVLFLNQPNEDYTGGEFVLLQQTPRAQSKAIVLQPAKGDMLLFTTNFRPVQGSRGYYRVNMKHGVSEVIEGQRHTLGIIFHDAIS